MKLAIAAAIAILFTGCKSSGQSTIEKLAADYCDCFRETKNKISATTTKVIEASLKYESPIDGLREEAAKLDAAEAEKVKTEFALLGQQMQRNPDKENCVFKVEKKYGDKYKFENEEIANQVLDALDKEKDCSFTALVIRFGLSIQQAKQK